MTNLSTVQEALIWQMPGYLVWKNTKSVFLGCNKNLAQLTGFRTIDRFVGKTDFDIPCDAARDAGLYIKQDQKAMTGKKQTIWDIHRYADGKTYNCLTNRSPLKNLKGEIIGVICHMIEINNHFLSKIPHLLCTPNALCLATQGSYELVNDYPHYKLSRREEECLFYTLRGKSAKEIANILKISSKTVESYIAQIRSKQNCHSKSALIEKAISQGLMNIIPKSILSKNFSCKNLFITHDD